MSATHTPAPWVRKGIGIFADVIEIWGGGTKLAEVPVERETYSEQYANAQLMEAAPAMLAALESTAKIMAAEGRLSWLKRRNCLARIGDAIHAATGKTVVPRPLGGTKGR